LFSYPFNAERLSKEAVNTNFFMTQRGNRSHVLFTARQRSKLITRPRAGAIPKITKNNFYDFDYLPSG